MVEDDPDSHFGTCAKSRVVLVRDMWFSLGQVLVVCWAVVYTANVVPSTSAFTSD